MKHFSKRDLLQKYAFNPKQKGLTDHQLKNSISTTLDQCDDNFNIYLKIENGTIQVARFSGTGCAISTASTEAILSIIEGKSIGEACKTIELYENFLNKKTYNLDEKLKVFEIVHIHKSRIKCAMAPLSAIKKGIRNE